VLEYLDQPYKLNVKQINGRWADSANIDDWSQLVIKHVKETVEHVTEAPKSGIYKMKEDGSVVYNRMDTPQSGRNRKRDFLFTY
jgi:hypothetical protein